MGFPVNLDDAQRPAALTEEETLETEADSASLATRPIVAIIDDGIGFLNARFRRPTGKGRYRTRFHAVWLQALETRPTGPGPRRAYIGEIYSRKDIDRWLAKGSALEESAVYSALNQQLYGIEGDRSLEFGASHGTHILDLAAGADPEDGDDPVHKWPLIGVQLPPEAVSDTSGMRFESYMVQAVRWILSESARIDAKAPVIINLSLGMMAGPKDGSNFAEYQIAREAALWEGVTGQPVRVVWAFGNSRRSRQVAQFDFDPASGITEHHITWRAQPDDQTASYVEIRTPDGVSSDLIEIALTTPSGADSGFVPLPTGAFRTLDANGKPVARIYHIEPHVLSDTVTQAATHTLAMAPNEAQVAGEPLAEAGAWRIAVRYTGKAQCSVHLQVQRDESLPGYRGDRGRQSYFDGDEFRLCLGPRAPELERARSHLPHHPGGHAQRARDGHGPAGFQRGRGTLAGIDAELCARLVHFGRLRLDRARTNRRHAGRGWLGAARCAFLGHLHRIDLCHHGHQRRCRSADPVARDECGPDRRQCPGGRRHAAGRSSRRYGATPARAALRTRRAWARLWSMSWPGRAREGETSGAGA